MPTKSFSSYNGATPSEPFPIEINGTTWHFVPMIPGALLLDFTSMADEEHPNKMAQGITDLLNNAIVPEQKDEFNLWLRDPKNHVTMEVLGELAGYLAEVYTASPLQPSGPSSVGVPMTGPGHGAPPFSRE